jgi:ribosome biogenesis GTPase A
MATAGGQVGTIRNLMKEANLIVEVRDARGPSITSPTRYLGQSTTTRLVILTKADLADPDITQAWIEAPYPDARKVMALDMSGRSKAGDHLLRIINSFAGKVKSALGIVRAVVVGLPNVGKSTLINRIRKASVARVGDQPGVTRGKMWVQVGPRCFVLDTPGIIQISEELMRRAKDQAWKLSLLNIVPENAMDAEETVNGFLSFLLERPELVTEPRFRHLLEKHETPLDILVGYARDARFATRGGDPDVERAARGIIGRFRRLEFGRISLEEPGVEPV